MSISLALLPVALALKVIVGDKKLQEWNDALSVNIKTNFKDKEELISIVEKAGFDAKEWGDSIKTHMYGKKEFFFWEFIDNSWYASFSKYDKQNSVRNFVKEVESAAKRQVFFTETKKEKVSIKTCPTNFKDENLLIKTLDDYGVTYNKESSGNMNCLIDNLKFKLKPIKDSNYMVEIENEENLKDIFMNLNNLDSDYRNNVQNKTYENLKTKVEEKGYKIETEEIMEDNSIVITINV